MQESLKCFVTARKMVMKQEVTDGATDTHHRPVLVRPA